MTNFFNGSKINRRGAISSLALCIAAFAASPTASLAQAAGYPERPVTLVTPFGGPTDVLARLVAQNLSTRLGVPVVVDQRLGASGTIAMAHVARAAPDGYTLAMGTSTTLTSAPHLFEDPGYDPVKSFTYLGVIQTSRMVLQVSPALGVDTLEEFIALAKAKPNELNFGSAGVGNTQHLAGEQFNTAAGIEAVHVPYKTGTEIDIAILADNIQYALASLPSSLRLIQSGKLKALAVTGNGRTDALPDIPTLSEKGYPDLIPDQFFGFVGPANMPAEIVETISAALQDSLRDPKFQQLVRQGGAEPSQLGPDEFHDLATTHSNAWGELIRRLNIRLH